MAKNVVLLTLDTMRKDVVGCYGSGLGLTPFIDSLADKCIRFAGCQAIGPYTQASFPGILTSSYSLDHADHGRADKLSPARTLISEVLTRACCGCRRVPLQPGHVRLLRLEPRMGRFLRLDAGTGYPADALHKGRSDQ